MSGMWCMSWMPMRCMHAAQALVGQHDFTTFRAAECQAKSPVKTWTDSSVRRAADEIHIEASARSFLHTRCARWSAR